MNRMKINSIATKFFENKIDVNRIKSCIQSNSIFFILTSIFFILRLNFTILQDVYVPDELWHSGYMKHIEVINYQGFGAIYWIFGYIVHTIFGNSYTIVLRFLSLLSIFIGGWYLCKIIKSNDALYSSKVLTFCLLLAYYATPFFWYTGKIITPEFYLISIIFYAYYRIISSTESSKVSWLLLGLSMGVKMTSIMAVLPIAVYSFFFLKKAIN